MHHVLYPNDDSDYMCHEKKEEDTPALKIAVIHQYEDSKLH